MTDIKPARLRALNISDRDIFSLSRMILVPSSFGRIGDHAETIIQSADRMKAERAVISEVAMGGRRAQQWHWRGNYFPRQLTVTLSQHLPLPFQPLHQPFQR